MSKRNEERLLKIAACRRADRERAGINRPTYRFKRYGLTGDMVIDILDRQKNACAICRREFVRQEFMIDHCHAQGHVRGFLCHSCNVALGMFKDQIPVLEAAISYLKTNIININSNISGQTIKNEGWTEV